jgi:hypothetical protein
MNAQPVDVLEAVDERIDVGAVLRAAEALAALRLGQKRRKFDAETAKGRIPHPDSMTKLDRAEYLRDQIRTLRGAVEELVESARAMYLEADRPSEGRFDTSARDFLRADERCRAALARFGDVA